MKRLCGLCPFKYKYECYSARCLAYRFTGSLLGDDLTYAFIGKAIKNTQSISKNLYRAILKYSFMKSAKKKRSHYERPSIEEYNLDETIYVSAGKGSSQWVIG